MKSMKLDRFLVSASPHSRRDIYELVTSGAVSVNGQVVSDMTMLVRPDRDTVTVHDETVFLGQLYYYKFYKPLGVLSTMHDPKGRLSVVAYMKKLPKGVFPVGRLDRKTSGLLLLTNDGGLANSLMHPSFKLPKTYRVGLDKGIKFPDVESLVGGFFLEDGPVKFDSVTVLDKRTLDVTLSEGRNRIVRRSFATLGYEVVKLHRSRIGEVQLGTLAPGQTKPLSEKELRSLMP